MSETTDQAKLAKLLAELFPKSETLGRLLSQHRWAVELVRELPDGRHVGAAQYFAEVAESVVARGDVSALLGLAYQHRPNRLDRINAVASDLGVAGLADAIETQEPPKSRPSEGAKPAAEQAVETETEPSASTEETSGGTTPVPTDPEVAARAKKPKPPDPSVSTLQRTVLIGVALIVIGIAVEAVFPQGPIATFGGTAFVVVGAGALGGLAHGKLSGTASLPGSGWRAEGGLAVALLALVASLVFGRGGSSEDEAKDPPGTSGDTTSAARTTSTSSGGDGSSTEPQTGSPVPATTTTTTGTTTTTTTTAAVTPGTTTKSGTTSPPPPRRCSGAIARQLQAATAKMASRRDLALSSGSVTARVGGGRVTWVGGSGQAPPGGWAAFERIVNGLQIAGGPCITTFSLRP